MATGNPRRVWWYLKLRRQLFYKKESWDLLHLCMMLGNINLQTFFGSHHRKGFITDPRDNPVLKQSKLVPARKLFPSLWTKSSAKGNPVNRVSECIWWSWGFTEGREPGTQLCQELVGGHQIQLSCCWNKNIQERIPNLKKKYRRLQLFGFERRQRKG